MRCKTKILLLSPQQIHNTKCCTVTICTSKHHNIYLKLTETHIFTLPFFFSFQSVARRLLKAFPLQVHKQVQPKTITVQRVESAFSEAFPSHSSSWSVPLSCSFPQRKNCTALWYKIILAYFICPFFFFPPFQVFSVNSLTMIEMIGTCSVSVWDANRWYL